MEEGLAKIPKLELAQIKFILSNASSNNSTNTREELLREIVQNSE